MRPKSNALPFGHLDLLRPDDLLVLDRGYPAAWLMAVLVQRAQHFCMRVDALGFSAVKGTSIDSSIETKLPPKFVTLRFHALIHALMENLG